MVMQDLYQQQYLDPRMTTSGKQVLQVTVWAYSDLQMGSSLNSGPLLGSVSCKCAVLYRGPRKGPLI